MSRQKPFQRFLQGLGAELIPAEETTGLMEEVGQVSTDSQRCVQCGVCSYNCPIGIPVRDYARQGLSIQHPDCIGCGQCIQVCPRGTLRWQKVAHDPIGEVVPEQKEEAWRLRLWSPGQA